MATPTIVVLLLGVCAVVPQGENPGAGSNRFVPETGQWVFTHDFSVVETVGIAAGIGSAYLLAASLVLAFPRLLPFVRARRRVALHRWTGTGIVALALAHGAILPLVGFRRGWLSGTIALAFLGLHGLSGAWKGRLARAWGATRWRYGHLATAWAALAFTLFHAFVSGRIAHG